MKILCGETSSNLCSAAILEDFNLIEKIELDNGLTHSETFLPTIHEVIKKSHVSLDDIDLLVCDIGPGSFTGIRIGIASIKAFSDVQNIPCVGVSSLEVLAYNIKTDGLICSTINCKNDNCYFALYELKNGIYNILENPTTMAISEVQNLLENKYSNSVIHYVGDGIPGKSESNYLNIVNLGIAGYNKFLLNNKKGEDIFPLYIKKPQAQIQLENKLKNSNN